MSVSRGGLALPLLDHREVVAPRPAVRAKSTVRAQLYLAYLLTDFLMITIAVASAAILRLGFDTSAGLARDTIILVLPIYVLLAFNLGAYQLRTLVSTAFRVFPPLSESRGDSRSADFVIQAGHWFGGQHG